MKRKEKSPTNRRAPELIQAIGNLRRRGAAVYPLNELWAAIERAQLSVHYSQLDLQRRARPTYLLTAAPPALATGIQHDA